MANEEIFLQRYLTYEFLKTIHCNSLNVSKRRLRLLSFLSWISFYRSLLLLSRRHSSSKTRKKPTQQDPAAVHCMHWRHVCFALRILHCAENVFHGQREKEAKQFFVLLPASFSHPRNIMSNNASAYMFPRLLDLLKRCNLEKPPIKETKPRHMPAWNDSSRRMRNWWPLQSVS